MAVKDSPGAFKVIRTEAGRLRVDIPAASLEAEDEEELVRQLEKRAEELIAAIDSLRDEIQAVAMRKIEQVTPRRAALEKLVEKYPAPQEWYDEPEWTSDARG